MTKRLLLASSLALLVGAAALYAEEHFRFPLPTFPKTGHVLPETGFSASRLPWLYILDVGVLVAALGLAVYLSYKARSRMGLFWLSVFSLFYFGFYRGGCVCPIGATQNIIVAATDSSYRLPLTVAIFFVLPLALVLLFGRIFCGSVCPLGAIQDVVLVQPIRVPNWLEHALGLLPYVYLGFAVLYAATGSAFLICEYDPFVGIFRLGGTFGMLALGAALLLLGLIVGRPYCRYLCPYGALMKILGPLTVWHVKVYPTTCIQCRLCEEACPFAAINPATPPPDTAKRYEGRGRLLAFLLLLPVLIAAFALLGWGAGPTLARLDKTVQLADLVRAEQALQQKDQTIKDTSLETEAFRKRDGDPVELYKDSARLIGVFRVGGAWLGAWIGLVLGLKLVTLSIKRQRATYEADLARCVACARCYLHCPQEHVRLGKVGAVSAPVIKEAQAT